MFSWSSLNTVWQRDVPWRLICPQCPLPPMISVLTGLFRWWSWGQKQFDKQFNNTSKRYGSWTRSAHGGLSNGILTKASSLTEMTVTSLKSHISLRFNKWSLHDCAQTQQSQCSIFKEKTIGIHIIAKIRKIMLLKYYHAWLKVVILSPLSNKAFISPTSSKIIK